MSKKDYKYEVSVKDTIQSLVYKLHDSFVMDKDKFNSILRKLAFELSMDDDDVNKLFVEYLAQEEFSVYENLYSLSMYLYYLYTEDN